MTNVLIDLDENLQRILGKCGRMRTPAIKRSLPKMESSFPASFQFQYNFFSLHLGAIFVLKSPHQPPRVRRNSLFPQLRDLPTLKNPPMDIFAENVLKTKGLMEENHHAGTQCRCWKNVKFSSKWKLKIAQNFP